MRAARLAIAPACAGVLTTLAACTEPLACPSVLKASIVIDVRDSVTGANVGDNTTVVAHLRETPSSPVETTDSTSFAGGTWTFFGAKGIWDVTLLHAGYAPWTRSNIVVKSGNGSCPQPETVNLTARLVPSH